MAMDHRSSSTFSKFPSLPFELREMVFEQALSALKEPRVIVVGKDINDLISGHNDLYNKAFEYNFCSFFVLNRSFLRATDPALALSLVCKESRSVVQRFQGRFGIPGPQPVFESPHLNQLSLGAPLRPQGRDADIFLWSGFTLLENQDYMYKFCGPANSDVGLAQRWLVPLPVLMDDLHRMKVRPFGMRRPLLESPHDIIVLVSKDGDRTESLKYSDLVIVSADESRQMVIPGLDTVIRDCLLTMFAAHKKTWERYERSRSRRTSGLGPLSMRVGPDLYFAYLGM